VEYKSCTAVTFTVYPIEAAQCRFRVATKVRSCCRTKSWIEMVSSLSMSLSRQCIAEVRHELCHENASWKAFQYHVFVARDRQGKKIP
jgi:hypothetical protein